MFRFTRKPSSGSHSQRLAKITHLVHANTEMAVQASSVLWLHNMTCEACVCCVLCLRVHADTGHSTHSWTKKGLIR